MKERPLPNFADLHKAFEGCQKFLKGVEPQRIHPYNGESLDDFSNRLPKDKVWQLSFSKYGRFSAEAVDLESDNIDELK